MLAGWLGTATRTPLVAHTLWSRVRAVAWEGGWLELGELEMDRVPGTHLSEPGGRLWSCHPSPPPLDRVPAMAPGEPSGELGRMRGHWRMEGRRASVLVPQPSPRCQETQAWRSCSKRGWLCASFTGSWGRCTSAPCKERALSAGEGFGEMGMLAFADLQDTEGGQVGSGGCCERLGRNSGASLASRGLRL